MPRHLHLWKAHLKDRERILSKRAIVATWRDVSRIAKALPDVIEGQIRDGMASCSVNGKNFVWERPLRKSDIKALGAGAPEGPILGVRTADLDMKAAMLATFQPAAFTTPHFNNYPAYLVQLDAISLANLKKIVIEAWLTKATDAQAEAYLRKRRPPKKRA